MLGAADGGDAHRRQRAACHEEDLSKVQQVVHHGLRLLQARRYLTSSITRRERIEKKDRVAQFWCVQLGGLLLHHCRQRATRAVAVDAPGILPPEGTCGGRRWTVIELCAADHLAQQAEESRPYPSSPAHCGDLRAIDQPCELRTECGSQKAEQPSKKRK